MAKIQLSPEELLSQSSEMAALEAEYENLFSGMNGILNSVNDSWSANLANNFSGKINTAKNSFQNLTALLRQGAQLASVSARNFVNADNASAGIISGNLAVEINTAIAAVVDKKSASETAKDVWNWWEDRINQASEGLVTVDEFYKGLPEWTQELLKKIPNSEWKAAWGLSKDVIQGEYDWNTLKDIMVGLGGDKDHATIISGVLETTWNELSNENSMTRKLEEAREFFDDQAVEAFQAGRIADGLYYTGADILTSFTTSGYVGFRWGVDKLTKTVDSVWNLGGHAVSGTVEGMGLVLKSIPGCEEVGGYVGEIGEGTKTLVDTVSQGFKDIMNVDTAMEFWSEKFHW